MYLVVHSREQGLTLCLGYARGRGKKMGIVTAGTASYRDGVKAEKIPTHCGILSGVFTLNPAFRLTPNGQVTSWQRDTDVIRGAAMAGYAGADVSDLAVGITLSDGSEVTVRPKKRPDSRGM